MVKWSSGPFLVQHSFRQLWWAGIISIVRWNLRPVIVGVDTGLLAGRLTGSLTGALTGQELVGTDLW